MQKYELFVEVLQSRTCVELNVKGNDGINYVVIVFAIGKLKKYCRIY